MHNLRYLIGVSILLVCAGPAFSQHALPSSSQPLRYSSEEEEGDPIPPSVLVAIEDGELVMYEVRAPTFMDEIEIEGHTFGLTRGFRNFLGRRLSPEEMEANLEKLRTFANERALEMARSFCNDSARPDTVGASAGFTLGLSLNFSASWAVKDVCPP